MDTDNGDEVGGHRLEWRLTERIIGASLEVRRELKRGYAEAVYRNALAIVLTDSGLDCRTEFPIQVHFRGRLAGRFRSDLLVEGRVLVEVKAGRPLTASDDAQILSYLTASGMRVGLLLHFGDNVTFRRFVV